MKDTIANKPRVQWGKQLVIGAGCLLLMTGCATTSAPSARKTTFEPVASVPLTEGRITLVNPDLKFVVVDYSGTTVPAAGATLTVYRDDKPVGAVRLTEPAHGQFTTADILKGDLQVGDRVR